MSTATYEPVKVADSGTDEWKAARATGIGASEAADAAGLSKYGERWKLFHRKIGNLQEDLEDNEDIWFGNEFETPIVKYWEWKNERQVLMHPCPMYRHPDYPFILATPDAILGPKEGLEVKTMDWHIARQMGEEGTDFIPDQYVIQAQHQMLVMGWEVVEFAILVGKRLQQYKVHREEPLIDSLIVNLSEMWERIQNFDEPEPDWVNKSVPDTVRKVFRTIEAGPAFDLSDSASADWFRYEELGKQEKQIQTERKVLQARVLKEIGNRTAGILAGGERMVRRQEIKGSSYVVDRKPYISARAVKVQ